MQATTLRIALLSNALFSTLSGLTFIIFSRSIAELIGIDIPVIYQIIGVGLLGFASFVAWTGTRERIDTFLAALISIADFAWVGGTLVLILLTSEPCNLRGFLRCWRLRALCCFLVCASFRGSAACMPSLANHAHIPCVLRLIHPHHRMKSGPLSRICRAFVCIHPI